MEASSFGLHLDDEADSSASCDAGNAEADAAYQSQQKVYVAALVMRCMKEANGGREPETIWEFRRVARRFGVRVRFVGAECGQALLRQGQGGGVIYLPRTHDMAAFRASLVHELAEAALRWEGVPSVRISASRHEIAEGAMRLFLCGERRAAFYRAFRGLYPGYETRLPMFPMPDAPDLPTADDLEERELTPAQKELLSVYSQQIDLWQSQTELLQTQADIWREMIRSVTEPRPRKSASDKPAEEDKKTEKT